MMINPTPSDLGGKQRTEPVPPKPNRLVTDVDATFGQQVLDLPQRKRKPDIHHHREPNYLGRTVEISEGVFHPLRLGNSPYWLKPIYSDNAPAAPHGGSRVTSVPPPRPSRPPALGSLLAFINKTNNGLDRIGGKLNINNNKKITLILFV
jgi:hypothetical protein